MREFITALAMSTALVAAPAAAQLFEEWDADDDMMLTEDEFRPSIATVGWFEDWDVDDNDMLAVNEFETGLFQLFDEDDDGNLTVGEWDDGIDAWFGEDAVDFTFSNWDDDGNDVLTQAEFTEALGATGIYGGLAGYDYQVTQAEFDEGLFDWFEEDDDALLAEDEWDPLFGLLD